MVLLLLHCEFRQIITYFITIVTVIWCMFYFKIKIIFYFKNNLSKLQIIIPINRYTYYGNIIHYFIFIYCKLYYIVDYFTNLIYIDIVIRLIMKYSKIISINTIIMIININIANQEKFRIFNKEKHKLCNMQQLIIDYLKNKNDSTMVLCLFMLLLYIILIIQSTNIAYFQIWQVEKDQTFHCAIWCLTSKNIKNTIKENILKTKKITFYTLWDVLNQRLLCVYITIVCIVNNYSSILIVVFILWSYFTSSMTHWCTNKKISIFYTRNTSDTTPHNQSSFISKTRTVAPCFYCLSCCSYIYYLSSKWKNLIFNKYGCWNCIQVGIVDIRSKNGKNMPSKTGTLFKNDIFYNEKIMLEHQVWGESFTIGCIYTAPKGILMKYGNTREIAHHH